MPMLSPQGDDEARTAVGGNAAGLQWCALCGSEYLAGVVACADCLVPLVDNPPLPAGEIGDEEGEQIAYEYDDLDAEGRFVIDRVLADAGIVHAWEATTLVIAPYDEEEVDRLLDAAADEVEGDGGGDIDERLLDEANEQVIYDLEDWDGERRTELDGRLEAEGIAHAFDETGDLVVLAEDEDRVDAIVDEIEFPDQLPAERGDAGGLDAVEAVGNLFVATDRLVHDPSDTEGTLAAVDASRAMAGMATPFGFAPPVWTELVEKAEALRALLETEEEIVDDDAVHDTATSLRAALRPYV